MGVTLPNHRTDPTLFFLAVLNASQGRKGGATTFARSGAVTNKRK